VRARAPPPPEDKQPVHTLRPVWPCEYYIRIGSLGQAH
jgi:hypothetical protein